MYKRIAAGALWFYAGWYLGAMIAAAVGVSEALGPILGAAVALFVVSDPVGRIWRAQPSDVEAPVDADPSVEDRLPADPGLGDVLASR